MIDARKQHWESVYQTKKPTDVSWFQQKPTISLELIAECNLEHGDHILDAGGGASMLVDYLLEEGYSDLSILDISEAALKQSQQRLGAKAEAVKWVVSDITRYLAETPVALWHDRAVFHFLTSAEDRQRYVAALKRAVPAGGHVILASFAIGGPKKCSGLPVVQYDAEKVQAELGTEFDLQVVRHEEHRTPMGGAQKFSYFYFVRV